MIEHDSTFRDKVYGFVSQIPEGRVMTYGQLAVLSGHPRAARIVGQIAHFGPIDLPWHRVVNKKGGLARTFSFGGIEGHRKLLQQENIVIKDNTIEDIDRYIWQPK
ncbi:MAG: methylated-DNA--[protein]-cysteine S-methyltransferase [Patescibacteria group bacterium]